MTYLSMILVIAFVYKIGVSPEKKKGKIKLINCTNLTFMLRSILVVLHVPSSNYSIIIHKYQTFKNND